MCVSRSETDDSNDFRQTPQVDQDVAAPIAEPEQPTFEDEEVAAQPAYGSRITQRLPEGTHSGFIKKHSSVGTVSYKKRNDVTRRRHLNTL